MLWLVALTIGDHLLKTVEIGRSSCFFCFILYLKQKPRSLETKVKVASPIEGAWNLGTE